MWEEVKMQTHKKDVSGVHIYSIVCVGVKLSVIPKLVDCTLLHV